MASKDPKMSKQGDPDNMKHVTLKPETFGGLKVAKAMV